MLDRSGDEDAREPLAPGARHDVFISYSHRDKGKADALCAILERNGLRCWIAPRDVSPGIAWAKSIIQGINEARVFVLLFSAFSNVSSQVSREVERAANRELPIIPLRLQEIKPSETLEYFISSPHWMDALEPPFEEHAERLARAIERLLGEDGLAALGGGAEHRAVDAPPKLARLVTAIGGRIVPWVAVGLAAMLGIASISAYVLKTPQVRASAPAPSPVRPQVDALSTAAARLNGDWGGNLAKCRINPLQIQVNGRTVHETLSRAESTGTVISQDATGLQIQFDDRHTETDAGTGNTLVLTFESGQTMRYTRCQPQVRSEANE